MTGKDRTNGQEEPRLEDLAAELRQRLSRLPPLDRAPGDPTISAVQLTLDVQQMLEALDRRATTLQHGAEQAALALAQTTAAVERLRLLAEAHQAEQTAVRERLAALERRLADGGASAKPPSRGRRRQGQAATWTALATAGVAAVVLLAGVWLQHAGPAWRPFLDRITASL